MQNNILESDIKYNLAFYKILKFLVRTRITDETLGDIGNFLNTDSFNYQILDELLKNYPCLEEIKNIYHEILDEVFTLKALKLSVYLIFLKIIFLDISKAGSYNEQAKLDSIRDKLSVKYDMQSLNLPYSRRVLDAINTDLFFGNDILIKNQYFENHKELLNFINLQTKDILENYGVRVSNIFLIILSESTNQSIKSLAGSNYEQRCLEMLKCYLTILSDKPTHDNKNNAVEYDIVAKTENGYRIGFSIKRTLRERYKQNLENIDLLEVDAICVITLGSDLTEQKIKNILDYKNTFLIIAQEYYDLYKHHDKVISSANLKEINNFIKNNIA